MVEGPEDDLESQFHTSGSENIFLEGKSFHLKPEDGGCGGCEMCPNIL